MPVVSFSKPSRTQSIVQQKQAARQVSQELKAIIPAQRPSTEELEWAERIAYKNAWGLNKSVFPRKSSYAQEHNEFFVPAEGGKSRNLPLRKFTVGTDCSGMEAPIQALINMRLNFEHSFSCDFDHRVRATITANFNPGVLYEDITTRDNAAMMSVDVYVAGFPCQPFPRLESTRVLKTLKVAAQSSIRFWNI